MRVLKHIQIDCFCIILYCFSIVSCQAVDLNPEIDGDEFPLSSLCIIGDSISTFSGCLVSDSTGYDGSSYLAYYPRGDVDTVEKTWWYLVAHQLGIGMDRINNCSWSGSSVAGDAISTTNARAACSVRRIKDVSAKGYIPDIILCFISCNDWACNFPVGDWNDSEPMNPSSNVPTLREAYAIMLSRLKEAYPDSRIYCLTILDDTNRDVTPGWPSNNSNGVSIEEWNSNIVELAGLFDCDIIDMHGCGITYHNISEYAVDGGLHPNAAGMRLMADKVVEELRRSLSISF